MDDVQKARVGDALREKSGKKLIGLTVLTTVIVLIVVFCAVLILDSYSKLAMYSQYIAEAPGIVKDREEELEARKEAFDEDVMARGALGTWLYEGDTNPSVAEKLETIRKAISAESVSLTSETDEVLATTGTTLAEEVFEDKLKTLEEGTPVFEVYEVEEDATEGAENTEGAEGAEATEDAEDGETAEEGLLTEDAENAENAIAPAMEDGSITAVDVYEAMTTAQLEEAENKDGRAIVKFPVKGEGGNSLVFEFSYDPLLEVYKVTADWLGVLQRMLGGLNAYAFVQVEGEDPIGYPLALMTDEEKQRTLDDVAKTFQESSTFFKLRGDISYKLTKILGVSALALYLPFPESDANFLLVVPFEDFLSTSVYCALTLSVFIVLSLILFVAYVAKTCEQKPAGEDPVAFRQKLGRTTRPGKVLLAVCVYVFAAMLLMLEGRANIATICTTKGIGLAYEVNWHENQKETIRKSYTDNYRARTQAVARLLEEYEGYRTPENLKKLGDAIEADYVMLFDKDGNEVASSNSYTGFSVGGSNSNLSEEYNAVLLGYPSVVVGPEKDPVTKKQQIGTAILMTGDDGKADGFVLAVYGANDLNAELENESVENTINTYVVAEGNKAAVINNEDGTFVAHTDPNRIGQAASNYLSPDVYAADYAGFTEYAGKTMYVTSAVDGGKTLLFMVPERADELMDYVAYVMVYILIALIVFVYCPKAAILVSKAVEKPKDKEYTELIATKKNPLLVFAYGYVVFFTVLAAIAYVAAYMMAWPAFTYVFGEIWSKGLHLFSIWMALFFASVTISIAWLIRCVLMGMATRSNPRTRTVLKLMESFVAYAAGFILVLGILYMVGVDTAALIASAGIVSIAIGMGSKDMVADIIAGIFMAVEDSVRMGDEVTIGNWTGRVTNMGIRTTEIMNADNSVKIMNNSRISDVVNLSRQKISCVLEFTLAHALGAKEAEDILDTAAEAAMDEMPELYGSLNVDKVYNFTDEGFTVRLSYICAEVVRDDVTKLLQQFIEDNVKEQTEEPADEDGDTE